MNYINILLLFIILIFILLWKNNKENFQRSTLPIPTRGNNNFNITFPINTLPDNLSPNQDHNCMSSELCTNNSEVIYGIRKYLDSFVEKIIYFNEGALTYLRNIYKKSGVISENLLFIGLKNLFDNSTNEKYYDLSADYEFSNPMYKFDISKVFENNNRESANQDSENHEILTCALNCIAEELNDNFGREVFFNEDTYNNLVVIIQNLLIANPDFHGGTSRLIVRKTSMDEDVDNLSNLIKKRYELLEHIKQCLLNK